MTPRVALWGFYAYGSFGDDLSAGLLGAHLRQTCGADVRAYRLCEPYARRFDLEVAETVEDLVDGAGLIVFGEGSTLESAPPPGRLGLGAALPGHAVEAARVLELAAAAGIPIIGLSIGGDGVYPRTLHPPSKRRFLEQARYISVRYEDDLRLLREHGKAGDHFPDLLWQASPRLPRQRSPASRPRIGISVYAGQLQAQRAYWVPPVLYAAAVRRREAEFVFIDSANASRSSFRALPRLPGARGRNHMFEQVDADLDLVASLDLLVSSHLPLGIVAMSYGVPFLAVAPDHRASRLMRDIGLPHLCFGARDAARLFSLVAGREALSLRLLPSALEQLRARSGGHLQRLSEQLNSTAGSAGSP